MAKTDWANGDELTAAEMNALGTEVNAKAAKGDKGDPGEPGADLTAEVDDHESRIAALEAAAEG